jgi:hypothetical protein
MSIYYHFTDTGAERKLPLWGLFLIKQTREQTVFNVREEQITLFIGSLGTVKLREATVSMATERCNLRQ